MAIIIIIIIIITIIIVIIIWRSLINRIRNENYVNSNGIPSDQPTRERS